MTFLCDTEKSHPSIDTGGNRLKMKQSADFVDFPLPLSTDDFCMISVVDANYMIIVQISALQKERVFESSPSLSLGCSG